MGYIMCKSSRELKKEALEMLKGRWGKAILIGIVPWVIVFVLSLFLSMIALSNLWSPLADAVTGEEFMYVFSNYMMVLFPFSLAVQLLTVGLNFGIKAAYLKMFRDPDFDGNALVSFNVFKNLLFLKVYILSIVASIFIALWTVLLYIPGIIKSFSYSQADYILMDSNDEGASVGALEAITRSRQLMNGHKLRLFWLSFSFIGWFILSAFTCGVGFVILMPYINLTMAAFYQDLLDHQDEGGF